jgi:peptidyl-prolyl cis-trans isomerase D
MRAGMITAMRRLAGTWFAKALFVLLILSFAVWGIEDMLRNIGRDTAVARVAGEPIEQAEAQEAATRELQRINRALQGSFTPDARIRRAVAEQAVEGLVLDRVGRQEAARMRVAVPDEAVRAYIFRIPGFQGPTAASPATPSTTSCAPTTCRSPASSNSCAATSRASSSRARFAPRPPARGAAPAPCSPGRARRAAPPWSSCLRRRAGARRPTEAQLSRFHENNAPASPRPNTATWRWPP